MTKKISRIDVIGTNGPTGEHYSRYYVYLHVDPITGETVYVGKGTLGRAWDVTRVRKKHHHEHCSWMLSLSEQGYLPTDWVHILERNLTEDEAFSKEKEYLHNNGKLKFNRQSGEDNYQAKLTDSQAREIYKLANFDKLKHKEIADKYKVSRTCVSMIASGKQWKATTYDLRELNNDRAA